MLPPMRNDVSSLPGVGVPNEGARPPAGGGTGGASGDSPRPFGRGEPGRALLADRPDADSFYFLLFNSNKKAITLDLKSKQGCELFARLVERADVVTDNFAHGVLDDFGLGYEKLREMKPDIIHASIKGYGSWGPYRNYKSFDMISQATGGVLSVNGTAETFRRQRRVKGW